MHKSGLYEALFDHATESIIVVNESGEIEMVNPAAFRSFGYNMEELLGKKVEFLMPKRFGEDHASHRENYIKKPHARSMGIGLSLFAKRKDGSEFPVEISLSPFESENQKFVIAFIIDITKRKQAEDSLLLQQHELEQLAKELKSTNEKLELKVSDRTKVLQEALGALEKSKIELSEALEKEKELNELKSRFLSMASHEFRTPLTAILSSASLIGEYPGADQNDKRMRHVVRIQSAVSNLNDILSDFLSLSKIEEGKVMVDASQFNIANLVAEICSDLRGVKKPEQQLNCSHIGEEGVTLDKKLIRQIIVNLVSNAIKYSDEGKSINVQSSNDGHYLLLKVIDQGIGISDEDQKHLFERFFRGTNATNIQGTGLGLNIVANYVELLGGFIDYSSSLNKGSTFIVKLPLHKLHK